MKNYMEELPSGGTLIVTTNDWYIQYYFSWFDRRYKGTLFNISSVDIDKYIDASFLSGWMVYPDGKIILTTPYGGK